MTGSFMGLNGVEVCVDQGNPFYFFTFSLGLSTDHNHRCRWYRLPDRLDEFQIGRLKKGRKVRISLHGRGNEKGVRRWFINPADLTPGETSPC